MRVAKASRLFFTKVYCALLAIILSSGLLVTPAMAAVVFSNTTSIDTNLNPAAGIANPYPSNITVNGLTGTVTNVTVTLTNINHTFPDDVDILLVGPGGQNLIIMSDVGASNDFIDTTITIDDAATAQLSDTAANPSGSYKPTNHGGTVVDVFPAPAPAAPHGNPGPSNSGTATLASVFNGINPNGTWSLFIVDDLGGDEGFIAGGWSLNITTTGSPATAFSNISRIKIGDLRAGSTPFPSNITVSGLSGTITNITVTLNNITHPNPDDFDILLVGPAGQKYILMSDAGGTTDLTNVTFTFDDMAAAVIPDSAIANASASYKPANYDTTDTFPSPAPEGPYVNPGTTGTPTLNSTFGGTNPNGTWSLYVVDDVSSTASQGNIAGGWSLDITSGGPPSGGFDNRLDYITSGPSANLSDWAVVRAASATAPLTWSIARNDNPTPVNGVIVQFPHGIGSDSVPAFGNYAGGATSADDPTVWRATTADQTFYFIQQIGGASSQIEWGQPNDIVGAEGDYDGDGVMDPTVVRAPGTWFILRSQTQTLSAFNFGATATDGFLPGADYTGDGADDPAVIRLGTGNIINWLVGNTSGASVLNRTWGDFDTDFVLPGGDYDGDDKADFAVWRGFANPPAGDAVFYISENDGGSQAVQWGIASATTANRDIPLRHGDYDGDGITDVAVWRRSNQTFYVRRSSNGSLLAQQWGIAATDVPVASLGTF